MVKTRRTEIAEVKDDKSKRVTFCKRRQGLFKKAQVLSSATPGARVAILVLSSAGKAYLHGSPCVLDDYLASFEGENPSASRGSGVSSCGSGGGARVCEGLEVEWVDGANSLEELMEAETRLEEVKEKVEARLEYLREEKFVESLLC